MKNKLKHTPSPWKVRFLNPDDPDSDFFIEARNNNKPELGHGIEIMGDDYHEGNGYPREQRLADARLIAMAPYLLRALQRLVDCPALNMEDLEAEDWAAEEYALKIIKKATEG